MADFDPNELGPTDPGYTAQVLDEVVDYLDRFIAAEPAQLDAIALWCAHTHLAEQFDVVAYLFVTSAEKRSGKSLLLDIVEHLVLRGRSTANISPAALYRMIDEQRPTLLFDEIDNIFTKGKNNDPSRAELTGLINAGFRRGRVAYRMGGANMRSLEEFDAFGPKALAGIGACLPDPTADRCIPIRLERKAKATPKARYRIRVHEHLTRALGERLGAAIANLDGIGDAWPALPDELNDRQQDIWEPLLAVAEAAGGRWPARARDAARALHRDLDATESLGTRLLTDIRTVFTTDKILTKQLVLLLCELDESPWGDWRNGQGISSAQVANMLRPFGVKSKHLRDGPERGRGFEVDQFVPVFERYLEDADDAPGHPSDDAVDTVDDATNEQVAAVNDAAGPGVDVNVDAPEQGKWHGVHAVNGDNAEPPGPGGRADLPLDQDDVDQEPDENVLELLRGAFGDCEEVR